MAPLDVTKTSENHVSQSDTTRSFAFESINWEKLVSVDFKDVAVGKGMSKDEIETFDQTQVYFANPALAFNDFQGACSPLHVTNPALLSLPGMRVVASLKPWQVTGVDAIHTMRWSSKLRGQVLADAMGLGKTWTMMGCLL